MDTNRGAWSSPNAGSEAEISLDVIPLHSTNLLTVLDETGIIQYESPAIEFIYGYDQDDLVGEQVANYFHPDDRDEVVAAFHDVVSSEEHTVSAVEYRHKQADGTYLWVESIASANPTPDGHYVVNTRDISKQKDREHALTQMNERLEEFASVVSHDLRNPLNLAQGRLQLAQEACESEHLGDVADALDRMEALIEDLLSLSQAGKQIAETEPVALARLCESCWKSVATAEATLIVDTERQIQADRTRLRQLLQNLFRNAIEHGGTHVTVTVDELVTGFYVEDDGPGIPTEERRQCFEAGYSTTKAGTGLGLSIVKQIVDAHDWEIRLTDGATGGTRFEITAVEFRQ